MTSARKPLCALAVVGLTVVGLTACTSDPPGPESAAKALATALSSGDLSKVDLATGDDADAAASERTAAYEGLGELTPTVKLTTVVVDPKDDAAATATLGYTWTLDDAGDEWTYAVDAKLARDDKDVWRTAWTPALLAPDLVDGETLQVTRTTPKRAEVLGANDEPIVEDHKVYRIGIDKTRVDAADQAKAAKALAKKLDLDPDAYAKTVAAAGPKAFVEAITVRESDPDYDVPKLAAMTGVNAVATTMPLAPTRAFARPVLGTVGPATAEIVEKSDGAIAAGDVTGLSGLQRQYDAQLRGTPGLTIKAVSADGDTERVLDEVEEKAGTPLRTTIDPTMQLTAESILSTVEPASAIVAIQPSTGDVLAVASGPGGDGMSTATLGQYAPGSTFKVATALALLRQGETPDSTVTCSGTTEVDGRTFKNFPDYPANRTGKIDLRTAFANSCNTAFISQRDKVDQDALIDAAGSLGLTGDKNLGYSAFLGAVPGDSDGTDHAATMIGQGRVLASPLGMATVAASVQKGATVTPHLVVGQDDAATATATPTASDTPSPSESTRPVPPLTKDEASTLHDLMRGVVTDGGATFLEDVPGDDVVAKTGTAQFGKEGDLKNHVWMIADQGDLAVAVFVDEGVYGSTTAGPLLEEFLRDQQK